MGGALLKSEALSRRFGGVVALKRVDFEVKDGEIVGLIGPNGAGKTTFFNIATGLLPPSEGWIQVSGRVISGLPPHRITALGVARTYQNIRLFDRMSVLENVMVGLHRHFGASPVGLVFRSAGARGEEARARDRAGYLLEYVGLGGLDSALASSLPYGHQRRLEIARALATEPRLLLLDEPTAGMNPQEKRELGELIRKLNREGLAILLIEHDMKVVMATCHRVAVLYHGEKIADGPPEQIRKDRAVIDAYLGREE